MTGPACRGLDRLLRLLDGPPPGSHEELPPRAAMARVGVGAKSRKTVRGGVDHWRVPV
jgi:hypothetical protein